MREINGYLPLGGKYGALTLLRHDPKCSVYLASAGEKEPPAMVTFFSVDTAKERLKEAAQKYISLSSQARLSPLRSFYVFPLPSGGFDVALVSPVFEPLSETPITAPGERLALIRELGQAVSALHEHGYIHGGLYPCNIAAGGDFRLYGVFFDHAMSEFVLPNPHYEAGRYQKASDLSPGESKDIFNLGKVAVSLFKDDDIPLKNAFPKLAKALRRAFTPDPSLRWGTMRDFANALSQQDILEPAPEPIPEPAPKQEPEETAVPAEEPAAATASPESRPSPKEMAELYPALVRYLSVFDPKKSLTFRPVQVDEEGENARLVEKRRPFPWALLAVILGAAALIAYVVISGLIDLPEIG